MTLYGACTLSPMRKPSRNTVAASRTQAGHVGGVRVGRPRAPIQASRPITYSSGGIASGADQNTSPRLKK